MFAIFQPDANFQIPTNTITSMYNSLHRTPMATPKKIHSSLKRALHQTKLKFFLFLLLFLANSMLANNIQVSNVVLTGKNTTDDFAMVRFDISWENSWRNTSAPANWDAAWVFVKYKVGSTGTWQHATLNTTNGNHVTPTGSTIDVPSDGMGAFIYRDAAGSGTFSLTDVRLRWEYGTDGVQDNDQVQIKVFAIEMVYVPQGNFYVGDGSNQFNRLTQANSVTGNTVPFQITATPPTFQGNDVNSSASNLSARINGTTLEDFDLAGITTAALATGFPTGYDAFYCMKYETSQGQYRDFLNLLTRAQQLNCIYTDGNVGTYAGGTFWRFDGTNNNSSTYFASINNAQVPGERNGVRIISDPGAGLPLVFGCDLNTSSSLPSGVNQSDDGEWVAMGCLSWMAACSYLDWCGLRPMTELEFEKACRGEQTPVAQEMPWGQTAAASNVTPDNTGLNSAGTSSETVAKTTANIHLFDNIHGVIRVGVFADASSSKVESGSSYYGIMNFADNAWEPCVSVGCVAGRSYTGLHGDGSLLSDGRADVDYWPGINGNSSENTANGTYSTAGVSAAAGAGYRGGIWPFSADLSEISCRNHGVNSTFSHVTYIGVRGVRTAP